jgi:hypothetical protein
MSANDPALGTHLVLVRPEPAGGFTAQAVGLPELSATAATREEAVRRVQAQLAQWLADGRLAVVQAWPAPTAEQPIPWLRLPPPIDPNDPGQKIYLEELARRRQEDLERTLREYDQEDG